MLSEEGLGPLLSVARDLVIRVKEKDEALCAFLPSNNSHLIKRIETGVSTLVCKLTASQAGSKCLHKGDFICGQTSNCSKL